MFHVEQRRLNDREISWLGGRRLVPRETHPTVFEKFGEPWTSESKSGCFTWNTPWTGHARVMFHVEHYVIKNDRGSSSVWCSPSPMFHVEHSPKIGEPYDRCQHLKPCWVPHGMFRIAGLGLGAGWIFMFHVEHDATRILGVGVSVAVSPRCFTWNIEDKLE